MTATFVIWVVAALAEAAIWGAVVIVNKRVLHLVNPLTVNLFVRVVCLVALLVITVPLTILHLWSLGFGMTWPAAAYIAGSSTVTWLFAFNFYYFALRSGRLSVVVPITSTDPLFTALFAVLLLGATLGKLTIAGLVLGIAGIVLIARWTEAEQHADVIAGEVTAQSPRPDVTVVTLALATAAGWGLSPVLIQRAEESVGGATTTMIIGSQALGIILVGALVWWRRPRLFARELAPGEMRRVVRLLIAAGLLEAAFSTLFYVLIEHLGSVLTTLIVASSPVFAIVGGVLFLKERVGPRLAFGATVTLAGVFLATLQRLV